MSFQNNIEATPPMAKSNRQDLQSAISNASENSKSDKKNTNLPKIQNFKAKTFQNLKNEDQKNQNFSLPSLTNISVNFIPPKKTVQKSQQKQLEKLPSKIDNLDIKKDNVRAIKNEILNNLNQARTRVQAESLFQDITLNLIASEMAENYYIYFQNNQIKEDYPNKFKHACKLEVLSGNYVFIEEDQNINDQTLIEATKELINILYESNKDKNIILDKKYNSCGVSIHINEESLRMVIVLAYNPIEITQIKKDLLGKLYIAGCVKEFNKGLFAIKIINNDTQKQIDVITHEHIQFNINDQKFEITYDLGNEQYDIQNPPKMLEFYLKDDPSSIKYGCKSKIKHISKQLQVQLYAPLSLFPQIVQSKIQLFRARKSFELKTDTVEINDDNIEVVQQYDDEQQDEIQSALSLGEDQNSLESDTSQQTETQQSSLKQSEQELQEEEEYQENQKLKNELISAISEANEELKLQIQLNNKYQKQLVQNWHKTGIKIYTVEGQNNDDINEIKYNNCLALTHQSNKELAYIKEKFEKNETILNEELQCITATCQDIKITFMNLKNQMQKNGVSSVKKKSVITKQIEELTLLENQYLKQIQEEKVELIKLKMNFDKYQRMLNSKDQFAEGLHLIDFEKLKIENQSLNEKIEERNNENHKLKKKNEKNIQILAHYQEKLLQVNQKIQNLQIQNEKLEDEFRMKKNKIPEHEKDLQTEKIKMAKLTQETGIVKNKFLKMDFIKRQQNVQKLENDKDYLEKSLQQKIDLIQKYTRKKTTKQLNCLKFFQKIIFFMYQTQKTQKQILLEIEDQSEELKRLHPMIVYVKKKIEINYFFIK